MSADVKRKCVFCGGSANSREHVIAQRLYKRAKADKISIQVGITKENQGTQTRPPHSFDSLKVRMVCTKCNNGWMNDLEEWFEENLGELIEPMWPENAEIYIDKARRGNKQLVAWLLKTAVTTNLSSMAEPFFPFDYTRLLKDNLIPADIYVELAYSRKGGMAMLFNSGFQTINGGLFFKNQIRADKTAFRFIVQFNHLLLSIYRIPQAFPRRKPISGAVPVLLYPQPYKQLPYTYGYESIFTFDWNLTIETSGTFE